MIPWFLIDIVAFAAGLFGRDVYVRAASGGFGAQRMYLMRRTPGSIRVRQLKRH